MKKVLSAILALTLLFAFAAPAMAVTPGIVNRVEGGNPVVLGANMPPYVIFTDGQIHAGNPRDFIMWMPAQVDNATLQGYLTQVGNMQNKPGWWGGKLLKIFYGNEVVRYGNSDFWVEEVNGVWQACKSDGKISNTIWLPGEKPQLSGIEISQEVMVTTINHKTTQEWQGEMTPYQTVTQYVSPTYGSVTATTAAQLGGLKLAKNGSPEKKGNEGVIVANSNHFTYAKLNAADLAAGVELQLVVGNKIEPVGTGTVKIEDGKLAISFEGDFYTAKFGAVAASAPFAPKNGNVHSEKIFSHNNASLINMPAADANGYIYLYIHFDNLTYDLGIEKSEVEWVVTKEPVIVWEETIDIPVGPEQEFIPVKIFDAADIEVDETTWSDLEPGMYTVVFYDRHVEGGQVVIPVQVVKGETIKVEYKASYEVGGETTTERIDLPFVKNDLVITYKTVVK